MNTGPRGIHLVVTCTSRKRQTPHPELTIASAGDRLTCEPWRAWERRLERVKAPVLAARDLYIGQHWHVAKNLAAERGPGPELSLWICSAGWGLIRPDAALKSYSAVFTPGSADSVSRLMPGWGNQDAVRQWWNGLAEWRGPSPHGPRRIAQIAQLHPNSVIVVALSPSYFAACRDDIVEAAATLRDSERLLVVCPGSSDASSNSSAIRPLPLDARAAAVLGGTMGTLGVRFVRYLLNEYDWEALRACELRPRLDQWLGTLTPRAVPIRARHHDAEVAAFIRARLASDPGKSATRLLREYRSLGEACEQRRFHVIYSTVKEEVDVG